MTTLRRFFAREEEGQAVVLLAILMLALLFMVGLAIDAGQLYSNKRFEQEAADAAAFAGAVILYQGGTGAQAVAAATADATTNGYTTDDCTFVSGKTCVTVNWPPSSGLYSGRNDHIEVIIKRQVQTSLVPAQAAFNPVTARGVAGAENINSGYAIMTLDRGSTCSAFNTSPQGDLHLTGGGILVNSSCATAAVNSQGTPARFTISSPYGLDVNGNATGSWVADGIPVVAGHNQMPDPFANFPTPGVGGLPTCNSLAACQDVLGNQNPGTYILKAGMDTSGNANVNGSGVLLYNTYTTYPSNPGATPSCGQIKLAGNAVSTLSAQTTGTWKNLLVYQDTKCTNGVSIVGNGTFNGTGSFYIPSAAFSFSGQNATLTGSQLIANTVDVQNGNITINYSPSNTAQPILPRLAE
jgi:Flp pilus assembly protein TadG